VFKLYDYQQQASNTLLSHIRANLNIEMIRMLMVMATGLGKTMTVAMTLQEMLNIRGVLQNRRMLFICHSTDILNNAQKEFQRVFASDFQYGFLNGINKDTDADILFATFQTMINCKDKFDPNDFDVVIVDESHHGQAPTYKEVIEYFTPKIRLGMTATPDREDEKNIRDLFGDELVNIPLARGIANGWLSRVEYHLISDNLNQGVLNQLVQDIIRDGKRVSLDQINRTLFIQSKDEEIAAKIVQHNRKAIVFCRSIEHAENFVQYLPNAVTCHSKKSIDENQATLDGFKSGSIQYILVIDKFNEGVDIPDTTMLVFLHCVESKTVFFQQLGRGLRLAEGKDNVLVLDFAGNCERILTVKELSDHIKREYEKQHEDEEGSLRTDALHLTGKGFAINFDVDDINLLSILEKLSVEKDFYPTWQEASDATQKLGIKNKKDYEIKYREDDRLYASPDGSYADFPVWDVFLGKKPMGWLGYYPTWQEASMAALKLEIQSRPEYKKRHKEDDRLYSKPSEAYNDFPGDSIFFSKKSMGWLGYYPTWQETSIAVLKLGIQSRSEYKKRYVEDDRLPSRPSDYADFPSDTIFFGKKPWGWLGYYSTWQEASKVTQKLGIIGKREYKKRYREDDRLYANPDTSYTDWLNWDVFLGKKEAE
jgi:superfamily II DNA or RNA helicase